MFIELLSVCFAGTVVVLGFLPGGEAGDKHRMKKENEKMKGHGSKICSSEASLLVK